MSTIEQVLAMEGARHLMSVYQHQIKDAHLKIKRIKERGLPDLKAEGKK